MGCRCRKFNRKDAGKRRLLVSSSIRSSPERIPTTAHSTLSISSVSTCRSSGFRWRINPQTRAKFRFTAAPACDNRPTRCERESARLHRQNISAKYMPSSKEYYTPEFIALAASKFYDTVGPETFKRDVLWGCPACSRRKIRLSNYFIRSTPQKSLSLSPSVLFFLFFCLSASFHSWFEILCVCMCVCIQGV